jgi:NTP pyrophosphatase (non-canonical NTP hydrolase)
MMTTIKNLQEDIHSTNVEKGFWDANLKIQTIEDEDFRNSVTKAFQAQRLALVTSELSEALESLRKREIKPINDGLKTVIENSDGENFIKTFQDFVKDSYQDELADSVIRLLDIAGGEKIDLEWHILQKLRYNKTREKMHGKKF